MSKPTDSLRKPTKKASEKREKKLENLQKKR